MERRRKEQLGGKQLAAGSYGCVYVPTLAVKGQEKKLMRNDTIEGETKLDKLMLPDEAILEYGIAKKVQHIPGWKEYFLVAEAMYIPEAREKQTEKNLAKCEVIQDEQLNQLRVLRLTYGGIALSKFSLQPHAMSFMKFAIHFMEGVALMTLFGIVHLDLHSGNILVDKDGVPRIIDFNLSVFSQEKGPIVDRVSHSYNVTLMQEPPDCVLVNAVGRRLKDKKGVPDSLGVIEEMMETKTILKTMRIVLNITEEEQRQGMMDFIKESKAVYTGDMELWFRTYWRVNDSWAVVANLVNLIRRMSLWNSFGLTLMEPAVSNLLVTLKKMCHTDPRKRYDAVQGLAEVDPENPIILKYGKAWLAKVNP